MQGDHQEFSNRLRKRERALRSWVARDRLEAYRIYDRDLPNYPFLVDRYRDHIVVYEQSPPDKPLPPAEQVVGTVSAALSVAPENVHYKLRVRQKGLNQYERLGDKSVAFTVQEYRARFHVNVSDYLDTGLFLDHRPLRKKLQTPGPQYRFLNLFCYTASVSVAAALGGARCTSVDMSRTYLNWARKNFTLSGLPPEAHEFVHADALEFLRQPTARFDRIFLDPPSFSNSKRMRGTFDVQRDHEELIELTLAWLAPGGVLFFSNNRRKFKLSETIPSRFSVKDTTAASIPQDFRGKPHVLFEIRRKDDSPLPDPA